MIPAVQIPDFAGTLARTQQMQQQGELSRLQMLAAQRQMQDADTFSSALAAIAPQLGAAEGETRVSLLAKLAGAGPRGAELALPMLQNERDRAEFQRLLGVAPPAASVPVPATTRPPEMVPAVAQIGAASLPPAVPRGEAPVAVSQGIAARAALDPNAPDYAEQIMAINDVVVGATMPGQRMPGGATPASVTGAPAPQPRQPAGVAGLPSVEVLNRLLASGNPLAIRYAQSVLPLVIRDTAQQTGLQPIMGTDAQGNTVLMFADGRGGVTQAQLPPGVSVDPSTREIRLGDFVVTVDRAGREIGRRQINSEGPARDTARGRELGETEGAQIANAPEALRTAQQTLGIIDGILNHRALNAGTGLSGRVLNQVPGTPTFDFAQRVEQLQGRAFLQAFESLRGGGAITQIEGEKATAAIARLNTAQSASDFRTALRELREVVEAARDRARSRVPQNQQQGQQPAPQAVVPGPNGGPAEPPPRVIEFDAQGRRVAR